MELYSITEVAAAFGLNVSALRYYEERGLLSPTCRKARVRYYDRDALRTLALLQLWHHDGMLSLDDTAALLARPDRSRWAALVENRAAELGHQIERLVTAKAALDHFRACPREDPTACPDLAKLIEARVDEAIGTA